MSIFKVSSQILTFLIVQPIGLHVQEPTRSAFLCSICEFLEHAVFRLMQVLLTQSIKSLARSETPWFLQAHAIFLFNSEFHFIIYFFQAESMKHEAGGVLGEVKRKQTDATKAVELLKVLTKLREARKQEAEVKGIFISLTSPRPW